MLIKTITNSDHKWEIYKKVENKYYFKFYEYYQSCGWRLLGIVGNQKTGDYSKVEIEMELNIKVI